MNNRSFKQLYLVAFVAGLSLFSNGAAYAWLTPLAHPLKGLNSVIPLTSDDVPWLFALFEIGTMIGSFFVASVADRLGRKPALLAFGPLIALTWIALILSRTRLTLYIGRTVQGILSSLPYAILPFYLAEISAPEFRGAVTSFFNFMWHLGMLYSYVVGAFLDYRICTYAMLAPPALFTITFLWCPETPYFLVMTKRKESAGKALALLRGGRTNSEEVVSEMKLIEESIKADSEVTKGSWRDLLTKRTGLKALFLSQFVTLTYIMTGASTIQLYVTDTVVDVSGSEPVANLVTIIVGVVLVLATIPTFLVVDHLGRRPVLIASTGGTALALLTGSAAAYLLGRNYSDELTHAVLKTATGNALRMTFYAASLVSMCCVTFGIEPVAQILHSELFTSRTRGIVSGINAFNVGFSNSISVKLYEFLQQNYGLSVVYIMYSCFSLLGLFVIYLFVPETKKKSFDEIQRIL